MKRQRPSIIQTLFRSLRLRCPACGGASIIRSPFKIKHHCTSCDTLFMREEGFFVGAILVNLVTTEIFILSLYVVNLIVGVNYESMLIALFVSALAFPLAFYHHSWSIWLGVDHVIEGLPKNTIRSGQNPDASGF